MASDPIPKSHQCARPPHSTDQAQRNRCGVRLVIPKQNARSTEGFLCGRHDHMGSPSPTALCGGPPHWRRGCALHLRRRPAPLRPQTTPGAGDRTQPPGSCGHRPQARSRRRTQGSRARNWWSRPADRHTTGTANPFVMLRRPPRPESDASEKPRLSPRQWPLPNAGPLL